MFEKFESRKKKLIIFCIFVVTLGLVLLAVVIMKLRKTAAPAPASQPVKTNQTSPVHERPTEAAVFSPEVVKACESAWAEVIEAKYNEMFNEPGYIIFPMEADCKDECIGKGKDKAKACKKNKRTLFIRKFLGCPELDNVNKPGEHVLFERIKFTFPSQTAYKVHVNFPLSLRRAVKHMIILPTYEAVAVKCIEVVISSAMKSATAYSDFISEMADLDKEQEVQGGLAKSLGSEVPVLEKEVDMLQKEEEEMAGLLGNARTEFDVLINAGPSHDKKEADRLEAIIDDLTSKLKVTSDTLTDKSNLMGEKRSALDEATRNHSGAILDKEDLINNTKQQHSEELIDLALALHHYKRIILDMAAAVAGSLVGGSSIFTRVLGNRIFLGEVSIRNKGKHLEFTINDHFDTTGLAPCSAILRCLVLVIELYVDFNDNRT